MPKDLDDLYYRLGEILDVLKEIQTFLQPPLNIEAKQEFPIFNLEKGLVPTGRPRLSTISQVAAELEQRSIEKTQKFADEVKVHAKA